MGAICSAAGSGDMFGPDRMSRRDECPSSGDTKLETTLMKKAQQMDDRLSEACAIQYTHMYYQNDSE